MKININKPLAFFDVETTGLTIGADRIIEISILKLQPNGKKESRTYRVNPQIPIPNEITTLTGISNEDVANEPSFDEIAPILFLFLNDCDLAGYNSNKFDIPMLVEEFDRVGLDFDVANRRWIDVQNIFHQMEQRTLSAAYKFYCEKELNNAHAAEADTLATYEILLAQLQRYDSLKNDVDFLHDFSKRGNHADLAGRLAYNEKKEIIINFGKHKGKTVFEVFEKEPSYYSWMMQGDFSKDTKKWMEKLKKEFDLKRKNQK
jgi:DNA polymerase-3 subunit epsilon